MKNKIFTGLYAIARSKNDMFFGLVFVERDFI